MNHLHIMEEELAKKWNIAQSSEEEVRNLQDQFLKFREERKIKESELKKQVDSLKYELEQERRDKDMEVQHIKLVSETERLNLKSEFEVKVDILTKENAFLKEERKKHQAHFREYVNKTEQELRSKNEEVEVLKNELLILKREYADKDRVFEENDEHRV